MTSENPLENEIATRGRNPSLFSFVLCREGLGGALIVSHFDREIV